VHSQQFGYPVQQQGYTQQLLNAPRQPGIYSSYSSNSSAHQVCRSVSQCVAECCRVLQCHSIEPLLQFLCASGVLWCVPVCCSALQYVAVCCSVIHSSYSSNSSAHQVCCSVLQCVVVCCSVIHSSYSSNSSVHPVCCSVLQLSYSSNSFAHQVCCSVLQRVAACFSVLQCHPLELLLQFL